MAIKTWVTPTSGDWNTGTLWDAGTVPVATDDVVFDDTNVTTKYTVTVAAGETVTINSLTLNPNGGPNQTTGYVGAVLEMDGTMIFGPGSTGLISGSLQTELLTNGGTFINAGTVAPFILGTGNVLFEGTNGFYVEDQLQSQGTVVVDTARIDEYDAVNNTLTDGIFSAVGQGNMIELGGTLGTLDVNIIKIAGPPIDQSLGFTPWTELTLDGPDTQILEWHNGTYVAVESTLNDIGARGTLDVLDQRNYSSANALTVEAGGMLNLQAGTVAVNGITLNASAAIATRDGTLVEGGILQGTGTITNGVVNNGTISVLAGTLANSTTLTTVLDIVGALSGTGTVVFDADYRPLLGGGTLTTVATGGTLEVGSVEAGQTILMNGDDTLILDQPTAFAGTINAKAGDKVILQGVTATSAVNNNGTLVFSNGTVAVASLKVAGDAASASFTAGGSIVPIGTVTPTPTSGQFTIEDSTTQQVSAVAGAPYSGPVAGLTSQFVFPTSDQVMVRATTPNVFIQVGKLGGANPLVAGIDVSASNGDNVLDSYANSSFLIDGSGIDQNYIDARGATQNSWSTIANFHSGDNVTVWGLTAQDFTLQWLGDTLGATGWTGLTGVYTSNTSGLAIGVTLTGYTMADVSNGRLAVSYNTIDGNVYASIHAN